MLKGFSIRPPFFEIGPKAYMYGDTVVKLAKAAADASRRYNVPVIFTPQPTDLYRIAHETEGLYLCAQHMDPLPVGRGLGSILPEAVAAAGAKGVMLNHCEKPVSLPDLKNTIQRAAEVGLFTIVCADSIAEASAIAHLGPDIIEPEPSELIGGTTSSDVEYVTASTKAVKDINPDIYVLQGAGIHSGEDVYKVIYAGADATGSSSAVCKAADPGAMIDEMLAAAREAYDARIAKFGK